MFEADLHEGIPQRSTSWLTKIKRDQDWKDTLRQQIGEAITAKNKGGCTGTYMINEFRAHLQFLRQHLQGCWALYEWWTQNLHDTLELDKKRVTKTKARPGSTKQQGARGRKGGSVHAEGGRISVQ